MPSKEEYFDATTPSPSNSHWLPWIQKQLITHGVLAQTIELPEPYEPVYEKWGHIFNQLLIDEETILIGHSCGAGFLVRWLSENKVKTGKVALVAPFLDPDHDEVQSNFFHFQIDSNIIERVKRMAVFFSTDDEKEILASVNQIRMAIPAIEMNEFVDKGHFTFGDMKSEEFPELLDWLVK